ncbi:TIGR00282 family metallophosphoesterase [Microaerobacter geothermalis]|uniref:TIGR00282 family metallophosphoesterase n=1 Tax=Microaerobacter geothermalis TaxID=674972 RepID=UPI001F1F4FA7|nr:TIGR00282 family metallophosphoesterase [Microaerobacter geothermalis]MCF6093147.1 TIGR00282 family metallophosphoesterase [Microaerobacter geothermalis]
MRLLFIGDIVGSLGRGTLQRLLPELKRKYQPTFTVVNGENAAGGRGINLKIARKFFEWGVQGITLGNHTWDNKEIFDFIDEEKKMVRPANFPKGTPGLGYTFLKSNNKELAVINLQGRTFLPSIDCPFRKADEILQIIGNRTKYILVDFHGEATSEKLAMGWYLDGRVSAVVGTHTHVQTSDARILPKGTAYITDVGMVGSYDGILGMEKEAVIKKFITQLPVRFDVVEKGSSQLNAVVIQLSPETGQATQIEKIHIVEEVPSL